MEKYGTYNVLECNRCHKIINNPVGTPYPVCDCVREKIAEDTNLKYPGWSIREDLENKEQEWTEITPAK